VSRDLAYDAEVGAVTILVRLEGLSFDQTDPALLVARAQVLATLATSYRMADLARAVRVAGGCPASTDLPPPPPPDEEPF